VIAIETIDRTALLERVETLRRKAARPDAGIPYGTLAALGRIVGQLSLLTPDWTLVLDNARSVMYWYFDQGCSEVSLQRELGCCAKDMAKALGVRDALRTAQRVAGAPDAPAETGAIIAILQQMKLSFGPDARLDEPRQHRLSADLKAIVKPRRDSLQYVLGRQMAVL